MTIELTKKEKIEYIEIKIRAALSERDMILNNIEYPENISNPEGFTNIEIINDMQILLQSVQNKLKFLNEELFKLNLL